MSQPYRQDPTISTHCLDVTTFTIIYFTNQLAQRGKLAARGPHRPETTFNQAREIIC
jgi:hypothetical protein